MGPYLRAAYFQKENPVKLSPKENDLLRLLALHKNDLMPRELALTKIWRDDIILHLEVWMCISLNLENI